LEEIENSLNEEILLEELEIPEKNQVDIGSYGEVKIAYWRKTKVAVKFLKVGMAGENDITISFIEEFNLLKKLRQPNILLVLGGNITKGNELFMVTEFCEKGNLFDYLHNTSKSVIPIKQKLTMALGICKGMNYLHSFRPPILHRDLKSLNILVDKFNEVKITDFGWARLKSEYMTRERGTFQWMSPEIISGSSYTEKADVYSFGIILWEFWSVEPPYYQIPAKEVAENVRNNKEYRPPISDEVPEEISSLIKACWDYDPEARPTFEEIVIYLKKILGED
ncbi:MAG: protein kinase, partial [archaeon]|nr:protein kinase [archaeon]